MASVRDLNEHGGRGGQGDTLALAGGAPVRLPREPLLWSVHTDKPVEAHLETAHGRRFLVALDDGDLLFGLGGAEDAALAVIGPAGARIEPCDPARVAADRLAEAADRWVAGAARLVPRDQRDAKLLHAGARCRLTPGWLFRAARGVVWLAGPGAARFALAGMEAEVDGPASLPLAGTLGVEARAAASGWTLSSAELAQENALLPAMARFGRLLPTLLLDVIDRQEADVLARVATARRSDETARRQGVRRLETIAVRFDENDQPSAGELGTLAAAISAALDALPHPHDRRRLAAPDADFENVPSIARRCGVRARRIMLVPGWETGDQGPLVARTESGEPLALLPRGRTYHVFDPRLGSDRPLDAATAEALAPSAFSLIRSLPDQVGGALGLARFALAGSERDLLTAILVGAGTGLLAALGPIAIAYVLDDLVPGGERGLIVQVAVALALAALLSLFFAVTRAVALQRIDGRSSAAVQSAALDRLIGLPTGFFRDYAAGDLAERVQGLEAVRNAIVDVALGAAITFSFSIFYVVLLFVYAPALAGVAVLLTLVYAGVAVLAGIAQLRYGRIVARVSGKLAALVFEQLRAVRKLRVAGAEARAFRRWSDSYGDERRAVLAAGRARGRLETFGAGFEVAALAALYAAAVLLGEGLATTGAFVAFLAAYNAFQGALFGVVGAALTVLSSAAQYERARPILETEPESSSDRADPGRLSGRIDVSGLVFGYPDGSRILDGVDMSIEPGAFVAVVGPSGSGKSTLLRLLLGFETPSTGTVLYDGRDLATLDPTLVRRQIGVVMQSSRIFAGSIHDNIRGAEELSYEDCLAAALAAGLESDLETLPMGLHTPLTEGAEVLSGGQRQRILIARAIAARPNILFLDEATSALDNRTQQIVADTFEHLAVTRLAIAHRLSTIRQADRILFLEDGRFVESGSFDELMALDGRFATFARRQMT
ncbi:MAG: NHLP bacteriocin export ABC transporter permease/ATPase subunit [Alphaproteobacteria bacterium]